MVAQHSQLRTQCKFNFWPRNCQSNSISSQLQEHFYYFHFIFAVFLAQVILSPPCNSSCKWSSMIIRLICQISYPRCVTLVRSSRWTKPTRYFVFCSVVFGITEAVAMVFHVQALDLIVWVFRIQELLQVRKLIRIANFFCSYRSKPVEPSSVAGLTF